MDKVLNDYVSEPDLALQLGVCIRTLIRWRNLKSGPPSTFVGRKPYYRILSVKIWLQAQEGKTENSNAREMRKVVHPFLTKEHRKRREELLFLQDGKCAICTTNIKDTKDAPHLDHCHETGELRGLLCSRCNHGIGNLADSPELTLKAHQYLMQYKIG